MKGIHLLVGEPDPDVPGQPLQRCSLSRLPEERFVPATSADLDEDLHLLPVSAGEEVFSIADRHGVLDGGADSLIPGSADDLTVLVAVFVEDSNLVPRSQQWHPVEGLELLPKLYAPFTSRTQRRATLKMWPLESGRAWWFGTLGKISCKEVYCRLGL